MFTTYRSIRFFTFVVLMSACFQPVLPMIAMVPRADRTFMQASDQAILEKNAMHLCITAQDLLNRATVHGIHKLPTHEQVIIKKAHHILKYMPLIRDWYVKSNNQANTIKALSELVLPVCTELTLAKNYFSSFKQALPNPNNTQESLRYLIKAIHVLTECFGITAQPKESLHNKVHTLVNQYPSTKPLITGLYNGTRNYVPGMLKLVGYWTGGHWLQTIVKNTLSDIVSGTFKNPIYKYEPVSSDVVQNRGLVSHILWTETMTRLWDYWVRGYVCSAAEQTCMHAIGFQDNIFALATNLLWSSRFLVPVTLAYYAAGKIQKLKPLSLPEPILQKSVLQEKSFITHPLPKTLTDIIGHSNIIMNGKIVAPGLAIMHDALIHPFAYAPKNGTMSLFLHNISNCYAIDFVDALAHTTNTQLIRINTSDLINDDPKQCRDIAQAAYALALMQPRISILVHINDDADVFNVHTLHAALRTSLQHMISGMFNPNPYVHVYYCITSNATDIDRSIKSTVTYFQEITKPTAEDRRAMIMAEDNKYPSTLVTALVKATEGYSHQEMLAALERGRHIGVLHNMTPAITDFVHIDHNPLLLEASSESPEVIE